MSGEAARPDCLVSAVDGQLTAVADTEERELGKAVPSALTPAADAVIASLAGRYPLVLMEKAESASTMGAMLHFWGLAVRQLEKVEVDKHPDEELREQLAEVADIAGDSVQVLITDWLGDQSN